jgi:hypothetical protein
MPLPPDYVARKGDVLLIAVVVLLDDERVGDSSYLFVKAPHCHSTIALNREHLDEVVHKIKHKVWRKDERVRFRARGSQGVIGTVEAMGGGAVMLRLDPGVAHKNAIDGVLLVHANDIEPVPPPLQINPEAFFPAANDAGLDEPAPAPAPRPEGDA